MGCNGLVLRREKPEPPMSQLGSKPVNLDGSNVFRFAPRSGPNSGHRGSLTSAKNDITYRFHSGGHIAPLRLVFVH